MAVITVTSRSAGAARDAFGSGMSLAPLTGAAVVVLGGAASLLLLGGRPPREPCAVRRRG